MLAGSMCLPSYITVKTHEHDKYIEPGFNDFVSQRFSIEIQTCLT